jgi:hypothetical protein
MRRFARNNVRDRPRSSSNDPHPIPHEATRISGHWTGGYGGAVHRPRRRHDHAEIRSANRSGVSGPALVDRQRHARSRHMVFDTLYGRDGTYTPSAATATKRRRGQAGASVRSWRHRATRGSTHPIPIRNAKSVSIRSFSVWSMYRAFLLASIIKPTAYRKRITGVLNGFATFWNVQPA